MKKLACSALIALPLWAFAAEDAHRIGEVIEGKTVMYAGDEGSCRLVFERIALEHGDIRCTDPVNLEDVGKRPLLKSFESTAPGPAPLLLGHTIAEIKA